MRRVDRDSLGRRSVTRVVSRVMSGLITALISFRKNSRWDVMSGKGEVVGRGRVGCAVAAIRA